MNRDPFDPQWFLLGEHPGWRQSAMLSHDVDVDSGSLTLAPRREPPPTPTDRCLIGPCGDLLIIDVTARQVLVVAANGQIIRTIGPWLVTLPAPGTSDPAAVEPADPTWTLTAGCVSAPTWPPGTWLPTGVAVCGPHTYIVDGDNGVVHELDPSGCWVTVHPGSTVPTNPGAIVGHAPTGTFVSEPLDSGLAECEWHRIVLSARVPLGTRITVTTLTSDELLSDAEIALLGDDRWSTAGVHGGAEPASWDALVTSPRGRYLWLRITLDGDGLVTPDVDDVEVHFPRRTSRRRLPAVFQMTADSGSFVDRYLALTDTMRASVVAHIDHAPRLFDPLATPQTPHLEMLTWLEGWLGGELTEGLPDERRRRLLAAAAELYRWRGTPRGVRRHVSMWLDRRVQIVERFRLRRWAVSGHGRLGDASQLFGAEIVRRLQLDRHATIGGFALIDVGDPFRDPFHVYAHSFTLLVHACQGDDPDQLVADATRILEIVKPAHCSASVVAVMPRLRVGAQATLGIDSVVAGAPDPLPLGDGRLGEALALGGEEWRRHRSSLGRDARVSNAVLI
jgi:phage tail-like protein